MTAALIGYASRSWAALREAGSNPSIRHVVLAYIVFTVSKWALRIAKYVYLYEVAGPFGIAILGVIQIIPSILGVPFASGLGDRFARERILAVTYTLVAISSAGLAYVLSVGSEIAVFYLLAAAVEVLGQIVRPIQAALLPALARTPSELVAGTWRRAPRRRSGHWWGRRWGQLSSLVADRRSSPWRRPEGAHLPWWPSHGFTCGAPCRQWPGVSRAESPDSSQASGTVYARSPDFRPPERSRLDSCCRARFTGR